jgi:uncharacterized protein
VYTHVYMFERILFDEDKRKAVQKTRGVDILRAVMILEGPTLAVEDQRKDYGEIRYLATGQVEGEYYTIVYTTDGSSVRIITAWRAGRHARRRYQEYLRSRTP